MMDGSTFARALMRRLGTVLIRVLQWRDTWWFKLGDKRQTDA